MSVMLGETTNTSLRSMKCDEIHEKVMNSTLHAVSHPHVSLHCRELRTMVQERRFEPECAILNAKLVCVDFFSHIFTQAYRCED